MAGIISGDENVHNRIRKDLAQNPQNYVVYANGGGLIHKTAKVHPSANIEKGAIVGPECVVHENVWLKEDVTLGEKVILLPGCKFYSGGRVDVEDECVIGPEVTIYGTSSDGVSEIGRGTTIADRTSIDQGTKIGSWVVIGSGCQLMHTPVIGSDSEIGDRVSIQGYLKSGGLFSTQDQWCSSVVREDCQIGRNVKIEGRVESRALIADGAQVLGGVEVSGSVKIGNGEIVKPGFWSRRPLNWGQSKGKSFGRSKPSVPLQIPLNLPDDMSIVAGPAITQAVPETKPQTAGERPSLDVGRELRELRGEGAKSLQFFIPQKTI